MNIGEILAIAKGGKELWDWGTGGGGDNTGQQEMIGRLLLNAFVKNQQATQPLQEDVFGALRSRLGRSLPVKGIEQPTAFSPFSRMKQTARAAPQGGFLSKRAALPVPAQKRAQPQQPQVGALLKMLLSRR